jgi:hypothetical protein
MASLGDVFRELNALKAAGVVTDYAIGGATASLFYTEPSRTYDVDVFVLLPEGHQETLAPLRAIYEWAAAHGYGADAEHVLIHDVPVQFLPVHNDLARNAVVTALTHDYEGTLVRVIGPEHLAALALQAGGARRRERAWQLIESGRLDRAALKTLLSKHGIGIDIDHGS